MTAAVMSPEPHMIAPARYWSSSGLGGQVRPKARYQSSAISRFALMIEMPRNAWNGSIRNIISSRSG